MRPALPLLLILGAATLSAALLAPTAEDRRRSALAETPPEAAGAALRAALDAGDPAPPLLARLARRAIEAGDAAAVETALAALAAAPGGAEAAEALRLERALARGDLAAAYALGAAGASRPGDAARLADWARRLRLPEETDRLLALDPSRLDPARAERLVARLRAEGRVAALDATLTALAARPGAAFAAHRRRLAELRARQGRGGEAARAAAEAFARSGDAEALADAVDGLLGGAAPGPAEDALARAAAARPEAAARVAAALAARARRGAALRMLEGLAVGTPSAAAAEALLAACAALGDYGPAARLGARAAAGAPSAAFLRGLVVALAGRWEDRAARALSHHARAGAFSGDPLAEAAWAIVRGAPTAAAAPLAEAAPGGGDAEAWRALAARLATPPLRAALEAALAARGAGLDPAG